jgi:two-component system, NarL family, sensor histidine kinase DesK
VSVAAGLGNDAMALRPRTASWMLVAVHLAILAIPPAITSFGLGDEPATGPAAVAVPLGVGVLALQLRHSFAIAHGRRPRGAWWTLGALAVLVYVPLGWFGWGWVAMQVSLMASLPIVLRRWPLAVALTVPVLATDLAVVRLVADQPVATVAHWVIEQTFTLVVLSAALYGSARLVRVLDELQATRAELAELAVGRERLRVSRDLHDLLGQSLSAVSLKGDLAIRLLSRDPPAARAEIESLTGVARDALAGIRAVTRGEHLLSLRTETEGAAALLRAAGIDARIDLDVPKLSQPVEQVLAWALREGVTNVLRHSQARTCWIMAGSRDRRLWLEILNDGVRTTSGEGSGLAGLAERARAVSGSVTAHGTGDGRFRFRVEVPEEVA